MRVVLHVTEGPGRGRSFAIEDEGVFLVGRSPRCHFPVGGDRRCSRVHLILAVNEPTCRLRDLRSTHGTYVNGERVAEAVLSDADVIRVGRTALAVEIQAAEAAPPEALTPEAAAPAPDEAEAPAASPEAPAPEAAAPAPGEAEAPAQMLEPVETEPSPPAGGDEAVVAPETPAESPPAPAGEEEIELVMDPGAGAAVSCFRCGQSVPYAEVGSSDEVAVCQTCRGQMEAAGETIPGYRLIREVGKDEICTTWLAEEVRSGREALLKVLDAEVAASSRAALVFLREAESCQALRDQHVVALLAAGKYGDQLFLVTEHFAGQEAEALRATHGGALPPAWVVAISGQVLEALEQAHAQRIVHRDIRPVKILVEGEPPGIAVKVADFGLARVAIAAGKGIARSSDLRGALPFMAPEQATDPSGADPRADVFGLAATMYYLLTGEYCYDFRPQSKDPVATVVEGELVPIEQRGVPLPTGLADVIHRALRREANQRYQSAEEMRAALGQVSL